MEFPRFRALEKIRILSPTDGVPTVSSFRENSDFSAYGWSSHIKNWKMQNEICGNLKSSQVQEKNKIAVQKKKPLRTSCLKES
ncbi:hypothetical protein DLM78_10445 [Leptospira stimsonii]|uniref:Uncharacterized protein n=1 Tax=Leptospira stimsonii TaxID=2202203 RepID=A0A8B3CQL5_9LEPT|nr:hypothetical protein DLM78_10445 [Leptospira stimsonii]